MKEREALLLAFSERRTNACQKDVIRIKVNMIIQKQTNL